MQAVVSRSSLIGKLLLAVVWMTLFIVALGYIHSLGIPFRTLPHVLHQFLRELGWWGPLLLLGLYLVRPLFFLVPTSVLTIVSGSLYGPIFGTILNVIGDTLSACVAFFLGRIFGRKFVREHEKGWIKKYDTVLKEEGFFAVLFMRLFFFPFDTVGFACGMTGMIFRQYALGTLLGILPGTITLTLLGNVFTNPRAIAIFIVLLLVTVALVVLALRSKWVQTRLFPKQSPAEHF